MAESVVDVRCGDRVEFRILGSLEIAVGLERLELGGAREQIVLAMLLLSANRVVTVDRLVEAIYGEDLPPTSRAQAQNSISSLRRLFASHGHTAIISRRGRGYVIEVGTRGLDSYRFEGLGAAARAARAADHVDQAVAHYRDALRLWRGPALDGLDSLLIRTAASRLDEQRIATNEDRLTLELDLGRHHELVGELTELVEEFPLRERLRGQLMLALYRCDRAAEALQVYRHARRTMVDELGIEPGERLQQLEHSILTSDPALDPPASPVRIQPPKQQVPSLLPIDIADFTDRAEQIEQIQQRLIRAAEQQAQPTVPVVVLTGKGGVGKTSTAVHAAHGAAGQFGDGQLFADLHGGTADPVGSMHVLERFLRALGIPGPQIPVSLDERAEARAAAIVESAISTPPRSRSPLTGQRRRPRPTPGRTLQLAPLVLTNAGCAYHRRKPAREYLHVGSRRPTGSSSCRRPGCHRSVIAWRGPTDGGLADR